MKRWLKRLLGWTVFLYAIAGGVAAYQWHIVTHYEAVDAKVVLVETKYIGMSHGRMPRPKFRTELTLEYSAGGNIISNKVVLISKLEPKQGDTVKLRYRRTQPQDCFLLQ